jgi:hypothetical protein
MSDFMTFLCVGEKWQLHPDRKKERYRHKKYRQVSKKAE